MASSASSATGSTCSAAVQRFLRHLEAERAASPLTIKSYREDLLQLEEFLDSAGCRSPADAGSPVLRRFAAGLHAAGYAPSTVARKLASLRSFYAFGQREGWVRANPAKPLRSPRRPRKLPKFLTGDEIARLLAAPQPAAAGGLRDRAILELMYSSGVRVRELVSLDDADLDLRNATVRVRGKGRRDERRTAGASKLCIPHKRTCQTIGNSARKGLRGRTGNEKLAGPAPREPKLNWYTRSSV